MTIQAQIEGGPTLEFPDDTPPDVVQRTVRQFVARQAAPSGPPIGPQDTPSPTVAQAEADPPPEAPPPSLGRQIGRQVGLAARQALEVPANLIGAAGDAVNAGVNLGIRGVNAVAGTEIPTIGPASRTMQAAVDATGLPREENAQERIIGEINRMLVGTAGTMGLGGLLRAGGPTAQAIGEVLTQQPRAQMTGAIGAGLGSGAAGEVFPDSPGARIAAGLIGGALGGIAGYQRPPGPPSGPVGPNSVGPATPPDFAMTGVRPTLAVATQGRGAGTIENTLRDLPLAGTPIARARDAMTRDTGAAIDRVADQFGLARNPEEAGTAIQAGGRRFVADARAQQQQLENAMYGHYAPDARFPVASGRRVAADTANAFPSNPQLGEAVEPNFIRQVHDAIEAGNGTLTMAELRRFRSRIGERLDNPTMAPDVSQGDLRRLYGALTDDIRNAAGNTSQDALLDFHRANNFGRQVAQRIEQVIEPTVGSPRSGVAPEATYRDVLRMANSRQGADINRLRDIRASMPEGEWRQVAAAFLRQAGVAPASSEPLSPQRFMTAFNNMSPEAAALIFGPPGGTSRQELDALIRVINARRTADEMRNFSGTARTGGIIAGLGSLAAGDVTSPLLAMALGRALGEAITNPAVVRFMSRGGPAGPAPAAIGSVMRNFQRGAQLATEDRN